MLKLLFKTDTDPTRLLLRVVLGGVMFAHGAQKLFGWFGGHGFTGTMEYFTTSMGIPAPLAFLVILTESVGSLALVAGAFTRLAAAGIATIMIVATLMVHWPHGFFMNWTGSQAGQGFEYHLLALAMALSLVLKGAGCLSVDRVWVSALRRRESRISVQITGEPASVPRT